MGSQSRGLMNNSNPPMIQIYPSKMLKNWLLLLPMATIICVWSLPLEWMIKVAISFFILFLSSQFYYRFANYKSSHTIVALWLQDQKWILVQKNGVQIKANLLPKSQVYRSVFLLHFTNSKRSKRYQILIFPDQINETARRWLYVYLKYYQPS